MHLTALSIDGFKNLEEIELTPDTGYNIILGENAQGKTNLLEAIWMLTGCRSFRGSRERDYLSFSGKPLRVTLRLWDGQREQELCCERKPHGREKQITCNGVPIRQNKELFERFQCIAFTPEDIELITGAPEIRRNFLDLCYSQLHPKAMAMVRRSQLLLAQRNAVLKQNPPDAEALLELWDRPLAEAGVYLARQRSEYVKQLETVCKTLYHEISGGRESISMEYRSQVYGTSPDLTAESDAALQQLYYDRLVEHRVQDRILGFTSVGVQRDELILRIDGNSAKEFGSQGQKKSLALTMKLAQAQIYGEQRQEKPVILLDDVMGELDRSRQEVVCRIVEGMQVFVTTCHDEVLIPKLNGRRILLKAGRLLQSKRQEDAGIQGKTGLSTTC